MHQRYSMVMYFSFIPAPYTATDFGCYGRPQKCSLTDLTELLGCKFPNCGALIFPHNICTCITTTGKFPHWALAHGRKVPFSLLQRLKLQFRF